MIAGFFLLNPEIEVQSRALYVPFYKEPLIQNLGIFTVIFFAIVIIGASNAVNLTDGLDGLAAGCTITTSFAYALLTFVAGNERVASYLQIPYYSFVGELAVVCMAMVGASFGFLWFNCHPAKVFMGDTGSLALGGIIAVFAIAIRKELLIPIICGVFLVENISVILQVSVFKYRKKKYGIDYAKANRLLLMSPLHHHYQKSGFHESKIVMRFFIIGIALAVLTFVTLKLR